MSLYWYTLYIIYKYTVKHASQLQTFNPICCYITKYLWVKGVGKYIYSLKTTVACSVQMGVQPNIYWPPTWQLYLDTLRPDLNLDTRRKKEFVYANNALLLAQFKLRILSLK